MLRRIMPRVILGFLLLWVIGLAVIFFTLPNVGPAAGTGDHATYMTAARRWLAGESFYLPYQLAGPYIVDKVEILYPPVILPLLVLFSVLPDALWWLIPLAIVVAVTVHWRPNRLGWTLILACLAIPSAFEAVAYGNPVMWIAAFVALGTVYGWPAVLVALKPTLAPFMLLGVRRRSWWVAAGVLALVSLAFLPLWFDYARVVLNARGPLVSPLYSLSNVPLLLVPVVAWLTGQHRQRETRLDVSQSVAPSIPMRIASILRSGSAS